MLDLTPEELHYVVVRLNGFNAFPSHSWETGRAVKAKVEAELGNQCPCVCHFNWYNCEMHPHD